MTTTITTIPPGTEIRQAGVFRDLYEGSRGQWEAWLGGDTWVGVDELLDAKPHPYATLAQGPNGLPLIVRRKGDHAELCLVCGLHERRGWVEFPDGSGRYQPCDLLTAEGEQS